MGGIGEISSLSGLEAKIDYSSVPVHPLQKEPGEA